MYQIKIYNLITEVDKECWDTLTRDNIFMCYNWLKTFEVTTTLSVKPYYLMIFDKDKLVGSSVCYFDKKAKGASIDDLLLGRLRKFKVFRKLSFLPSIICYPRKGFGTHLLISEEVNSNQIKIIMNKLIDCVQDIAFLNKASICFQYVMDHGHPSMKKTIPREINKNRKTGVVIIILHNINNFREGFLNLLR